MPLSGFFALGLGASSAFEAASVCLVPAEIFLRLATSDIIRNGPLDI